MICRSEGVDNQTRNKGNEIVRTGTRIFDYKPEN